MFSLKEWLLAFAVENWENYFLVGVVHWKKAFEGLPRAGVLVPPLPAVWVG